MYAAAAAATKSLQSCPILCDPIQQTTRLLRPWVFPGKSTGVGCKSVWDQGNPGKRVTQERRSSERR